MMIAGDLALATAALFAGAASYISFVEQPARLSLSHGAMLTEWQPAYRRGTAMQAPLAVMGFLLGLVSWWQTGATAWLVGSVLMITNWPYTLVVIMPVNKRLMTTDISAASAETGYLVGRWGALHAGRTALGVGAVISFLVALAATG
jgi:hypothetical protein